ncbi:MAG: trimethylamine methyltransferase family protein [Deltaproteobacteria bacterium]|nr:trimethylamine methyltransferase family protein [Deltaproteobacteria bacterium]
METGAQDRCVPGFRLLQETQAVRIHHAVLRILDEVGVKILHGGAVDLLAGHGARVRDKNTVLIPSFLVEEAISSAAPNLVIYNRKKEPVMDLGGRRIYFGTGTDLPKTIDLKTREIRDTLAEDIIRGAVISDAMPNIDFIGSYGLPKDVPPGLHYIRCFQFEVEHSVKPVFFTAESREDLTVIRDMAAVVAGSEEDLARYPFLIHYAEPVSPLTHSEEAISKLIFCAEKGIPVNYTPALLAGSTGPVTLAGALSVAVAEALSGLVIHQLTRKGAPIISGVAATSMDMLHATVSYTSPEFRLTHSAYADLFHYYGLPVWGTGGCSDAQFPDLQSGAEYAFTILSAALDGANLIHDCGYMGQGFIAAPEMILFADEVIAMVKRYMRGFEIDEPHLALDVIREVGPGGHFLGERHTLDFFMKEHWRPSFFNRANLGNWIREGNRTLNDKLINRALEIAGTHEPEPLSGGTRRDLEEIWKKVSEAKRR